MKGVEDVGINLDIEANNRQLGCHNMTGDMLSHIDHLSQFNPIYHNYFFYASSSHRSTQYEGGAYAYSRSSSSQQAFTLRGIQKEFHDMVASLFSYW